MTTAARLAALERRADRMRATPTPSLPWDTLGDVPTIRWNDPEAVAALTDDFDTLRAHEAATAAADWETVTRLADRVTTASVSIYAALPSASETPEQWRERVHRLPVECPRYVDPAASW